MTIPSTWVCHCGNKLVKTTYKVDAACKNCTILHFLSVSVRSSNFCVAEVQWQSLKL